MPTEQDELFELLGSLCSGTITPAEHARLEARLAADRSARQFYFDYLDMHLHLRQWRRAARNDECGMMNDELPPPPASADIHPSSFILHPSEASSAETIPPIIIDTSAPASAPMASLFAPGGWAFSYTAATAITGVMLLVLWAWKVSHDYQLASASARRRPAGSERH